MAIRELLSVLQSNADVAKNTTFLAGMVLVKDTNMQAIKADRAGSATFPQRAQDIIGLAADDHARTGVTMISVDPVGSTYVDPSTGNLIANNNGYYVAPKRALADYYDEPVTNISDLTSGATGFQGPRRGVGYYATPSGQFATDQFVAVESDTTTADLSSAYVFAVGDLLTNGAGANAGKLIHLLDTADGKSVARVDRYDAGAGLLYITML